MPASDGPPPSPEVQRQLKAARSQLALYARDLKHLFEQEGKKRRALAAANQQLQAFARDVKNAFDAERRRARELENAYRDTILRLARASRYKDEETGAHIVRLSHYSRRLALYLGMESSEADLIWSAAPMHDVGKIGVPDAVMQKRGPLNDGEWLLMKSHPTVGGRLLEGSLSPLLDMARTIALTHHERWDGSGYPQGLRGRDIPLPGRIVMLADQYDALRSERPYKPAFDHERTSHILLQGDGRTKPEHFDPDVLAAFRELQDEFDEIFTRITDDSETSSPP